MAGKTAHPQFARRRAVGHVDELEGSGFPRAGVSRKEDELGLGHVKIHALEGGSGPWIDLCDV